MERNLSIILSVALCVLWRADRYAGCKIEDQCNAALIQHHPCPCIATCHLASTVTHPKRCIMLDNDHVVFAGLTSCAERSCMTEVCRGSRRCFMLLTGDQWTSHPEQHIFTLHRNILSLSLSDQYSPPWASSVSDFLRCYNNSQFPSPMNVVIHIYIVCTVCALYLCFTD